MKKLIYYIFLLSLPVLADAQMIGEDLTKMEKLVNNWGINKEVGK